MKWAFITLGALAFGAVVFNTTRADEAPLLPAECRASLQCWSENHRKVSQDACRAAVDREVDVKWSNEFYDPSFARTTWADAASGTLLLAGSFTKPRYQCVFDPASGKANASVES